MKEWWLKLWGAKIEVDTPKCERCGETLAVRIAVTKYKDYNQVDVLEILPQICRVKKIPHSYATGGNL